MLGISASINDKPELIGYYSVSYCRHRIPEQLCEYLEKFINF